MKIVACRAVDAGARGLKAYQSNGHHLAQRVLSAAYPVTEQLLGPASMADLARALWHRHPPVKGDLGLWGNLLPDFLEKDAQLETEAYLSDVAKAEWALHLCASASDISPKPASFALLTTEDPVNLRFLLSPGCFAMSSRWPIVHILAAHLTGGPSLESVGADLRAGLTQDLIIWRQGFAPQFRLAQFAEHQFLNLLIDGISVGAALDRSPDFSFPDWFPMAVQTGMVLGVQVNDDA